MSCRRRASVRSRLVILVGGDDATAATCARAAAPLPIIRAKHLALATLRVRSMRPVAVVVAADISVLDALELGRVAKQHAARVVRLPETFDCEQLRFALRG